MRQFASIVVAAAALGLAACDGGGKTAELPFAEVRQAMDKGDEAFAGYFATIRGKTVRWNGRISEVVRQRGDDYVEEAYMFVDLDEPARNHPAADATFQIPVSALATRAAGQPVAFVAFVREYERGEHGIVLKLELKELQ